MNVALKDEGINFSRYIIGEFPTDKVLSLYEKAINRHTTIPAVDIRLLEFTTRNPWSIGSIDAGLALLRPHSEVRRRLYYMFAILEAMPEYADYFLPKQRNFGYVFIIGLIGIHSVLQSVLGVLLVKIFSK